MIPLQPKDNILCVQWDNFEMQKLKGEWLAPLWF